MDATFEGTGLTEQDERLDYTDKSQPIREHDCTICMACQEICPEGAILIESANQEWHEKAAGTYVVMPSSGGGPHAHDLKNFFLFPYFSISYQQILITISKHFLPRSLSSVERGP